MCGFPLRNVEINVAADIRVVCPELQRAAGERRKDTDRSSQNRMAEAGLGRNVRDGRAADDELHEGPGG